MIAMKVQPEMISFLLVFTYIATLESLNFVEAFPFHLNTLAMFWLVRDTEKSRLKATTEKAPS